MFSRILTRQMAIQNIRKLKLEKAIKCISVSKLFTDRSETVHNSALSSFTTREFLIPKALTDQRRLASTFNLSKMISQFGINSKNILVGIDFNDLRKAPPAAFWVTTTGGIMFLTPPILQMVFGYSSFLTTLETGVGIAFLAMLGTMKWGHCLERKGEEGPTWHNLTWSMVPPGVAVLSFMLPEGLGCLVLTGGICHALYMDINHYKYPPWANALGCYISTIAIISLILTAIGRMLFG